MLSYFVLLYNINTRKPEKYDIMPFIINSYKECSKSGLWWMFDDMDKAPESKKDFMHFVKKVCMNRYWAHCEYEWLMIGWPPGLMDTLEQCKKIINSSHKIDAWEQIEPNLEIVTATFMANLKEI